MTSPIQRALQQADKITAPNAELERQSRAYAAEHRREVASELQAAIGRGAGLFELEDIIGDGDIAEYL